MKKILIAFLLCCNCALAAEYFVSPTGNDANPGTLAQPFLTFSRGYSALGPGDTLTIRGGTYRLMDDTGRGVMNTYNVTVRGYPGERAIFLGSRTTQGQTWQLYDAGRNVWRMPADFLMADPTGMFRAEPDPIDSQRVEHLLVFSNGIRSHTDVTTLVANSWTKADASGIACGTGNAACYLYLLPATGEDPNGETYELSQGGLGRVAGGANYMRVERLEFYYTQDSPIFFEDPDYLTIENNVFGHNSNGNDNAYGLPIWNSKGTLVRNNTVFDSKYWGGTPNTKGITFMVTDIGPPNIVEYNEIYDIQGSAGVGTKSGASNIIVRYNYIHDVYSAIEPDGYRCIWTNPNCGPGDPEYRPGGNWQIYGNIIENADTAISLDSGNGNDNNNNQIYNNVFSSSRVGIHTAWDATSNNTYANNIFIGNDVGLFFGGSGGTTTTIQDYTDQYESRNNLFFGNGNDVHLWPNWQGNPTWGPSWNLSQFQQLGEEPNSLSANPLFLSSSDYRLQPTSPAIGAGDESLWGIASVDIGAYPLANQGSCTPAAEVCDGADNDCDTQIDEGLSCGAPQTGPGDVNGDGDVDLRDIIAALQDKATAYNARSDLNSDGQINVFDLVLVARNYGANYGQTVTPLLVETFAPYTSTGQMLANFSSFSASNYQQISLDTTDGPVSGKSMVFTFPDRTGDGNRCTDYTIATSKLHTDAPEVWIDVWVKFSSSFTTKAPAAWGCASNPDYKFLIWKGQSWSGIRFDLKNDLYGTATTWDANYPGGGEGDNWFAHSVLHDDQWHRIQLHTRCSATDGAHDVWIDGQLVRALGGFPISCPTGFNQFNFGGNINQGPAQEQTVKFGYWALYTSDPGWQGQS